MAQTFDIRTSNVKIEIESVTPDPVTGKVDIQFKAQDPRIANFQIILAQYSTGGGYSNMTLLPDEVRDTITVVNKDVDIPAKGEFKSYLLVWWAGEDLSLADHASVTIKIQGQDSDTTADTAQVSSAVAVSHLPVVSKFPGPVEFLKDTTPEILFQVPMAVRPCNMHFTILISENADLSSPVQTISSYSSQTAWFFQISGTYYQLYLIGCPDISALPPGNARVRFTIQTPLDNDTTYYWGVTVDNVAKKIPVEEMDVVPANYPYYPCNLGFDVALYGQTIENLDINPEDLINPEYYGP